MRRPDLKAELAEMVRLYERLLDHGKPKRARTVRAEANILVARNTDLSAREIQELVGEEFD